MTYCKLTDEHGRTFGGTQWGENVTNSGTGVGPLCGPGWIHCYTDNVLAVMMNPRHAAFDQKSMRLWECNVFGRINDSDHGLKVGVQHCTTIREYPVPSITGEQRVAFGILCALAVLPNEPWARKWREWADNWLGGSDRTPESAAWAESMASAEAWAKSTAWAAAWAKSATWAEAWAKSATWAATAAGWAARLADSAAAARSAESAAIITPLDFVALAHKACEVTR